MVHVVNLNKDYWTLPGGGLEKGETFEEAAIREVEEETNLKVKVIQYLFTNTYEGGTEKCFLVKQIDSNVTPTLGFDPEFPIDQQELKEVKWRLIKEMSQDIHVSKVIKALDLKV